ncbi:hypothetical protein FJ661_14580 [Pseudarthrobacter phenanthrenivorans]|uniref:hypothetical protein n=1 Tax=Pseudarthrobacter phenanthrenivorans TaxID=361575 RepID=UPI00112C55B1|nr:hypothetical protein [Pseudarthrobacter phenanthrenivorans]TPV49818.1 hypothetical protein FJ661_14580 [Pseudarthrobacter phenanthrenivorans]
MRDMLVSLWRLWYVVLAGFVATAYICYFLYQNVPASYTAQGSLVMMPPSSTVGPDGNPFLFLGGMSQALDILSAKVSSEEIAKPIVDPYPDTSYVAEPDRSTSGSVLLISVTSGNQSDIMDVLNTSVAAVPIALKEMQDAQNIPEESRLGLMTLVVDKEPTEETKTRTASVLGAGGVGAALTVLLTGFIDGRILAWRQRKETEVQAEPDSRPRRSSRRRKEKAAQGGEVAVSEWPESDSAEPGDSDVPHAGGSAAANVRVPAKSKA